MFDLKIIYEDKDVLVVDKPAGIVVFCEGQTKKNTLIDLLIKKYPKLGEIGEPPRYGVVHRLDKDTSGVLSVAKNNESLIFFQKQFINRKVEKKYLALVCGNVKDDFGQIKTLIGRSPKDKRKQRIYSLDEPKQGRRETITEYKVLERYTSPPSLKLRRGSKVNEFTLLEVTIKTGRRHQIRCHLSYIYHPIAGDKMYGFKDSPVLPNLDRQFLHAEYLKIQLPAGEIKEFKLEPPEDLKNILKDLKKHE